MKAEQIINSAARNMGVLASNNESFIDGSVTREGMLDELNRIYLYIVCQQLMHQVDDVFQVEARSPLYRASFIVSAIDTVNNIITADTGVFGTADKESLLYNSTDETYLTIGNYISGTQVYVTGDLPNWAGDTVYLLSPIIELDGDMDDSRSIRKIQLRYNGQGYWYKAKQTSNSHYKDIHDNISYQTEYDPMYVRTMMQINDVEKEVLVITPKPRSIEGEIKITYQQLPDSLEYEGTPRFVTFGIDEVLINGLTAWGLKAMERSDKAQIYEENNSSMGGVVPKGMTAFCNRFKPRRDKPLRFKNLWRTR